MIKRILMILLIAALVPAAVFSQSFSAILTGVTEVPGPGDSDGAGLAVITIVGTTIHYSILVQNIATPTMAHIHRGAAGSAGDIVVTFDPNMLAGGTVQNVPQNVIDAIVSDPAGHYVNVHNAEFPQGAVRGQLAAPSAAGAQTLFLPVVGKVAGAAGTNFVTDVRIINRGAAPANVTLDYFQASATGHSMPSATRQTTIAPGEQAVLDDVIGFLGASGLGGMRIGADQNVEALARVINDLRELNQGTTGFSVGASRPEEAQTSGTIGFLSQASPADFGAGRGFRTNLGYFNASASPVTLTVTARRTGNGAAIGTSSITVPAWGFSQQPAFTMISNAAPADQVQSDFYVTWTSSAPLFVYGSVVDNRTGDSVLIQ